MLGAAPRLVLDQRFDPDVLDANGADLAAGDKGDVGDAALTEHLLGSIDGLGATDPVHHLFGRHFDAAVDVARRDAAGPEQRYQQAGGVHGVAGLFVQGVLRALYAALGGLPVDVVVHPLVDLVRVLAQVGRQFLDRGGVGVAKEALVAPLTRVHCGRSNRDRTFNHEQKMPSAQSGQAQAAIKIRVTDGCHR